METNDYYELYFSYLWGNYRLNMTGNKELAVDNFQAWYLLQKASHNIYVNQLKDSITKFVVSGRTLFGICLGFQLLFEEGCEGGAISKGLGLIKGKVEDSSTVYGSNPFNGRSLNIGWRKVSSPMYNLDIDQKYFYFVHRYIVRKSKSKITPIISKIDNEKSFLAGIVSENVYGFQFHPEKSGSEGLNLLKNTIQGGLS